MNFMKISRCGIIKDSGQVQNQLLYKSGVEGTNILNSFHQADNFIQLDDKGVGLMLGRNIPFISHSSMQYIFPFVHIVL